MNRLTRTGAASQPYLVNFTNRRKVRWRKETKCPEHRVKVTLSRVPRRAMLSKISLVRACRWWNDTLGSALTYVRQLLHRQVHMMSRPLLQCCLGSSFPGCEILLLSQGYTSEHCYPHKQFLRLSGLVASNAGSKSPSWQTFLHTGDEAFSGWDDQRVLSASRGQVAKMTRSWQSTGHTATARCYSSGV